MIMNQLVDRICRVCGISKPIEQFAFSHKKRGWRRHECQDCMRNRRQTWYEENRQVVTSKNRDRYHSVYKHRKKTKAELASLAERQRRHNAALRAEVFDHYGWACACCGEDESLFLSIDHVKNDGYQMRKSGQQGAGYPLYQWLRKHKYPKGYQTLCMNCNHGKSRNGGVCPHQEGATTIPKGSRAKRPEAPGAPRGR